MVQFSRKYDMEGNMRNVFTKYCTDCGAETLCRICTFFEAKMLMDAAIIFGGMTKEEVGMFEPDLPVTF